MMTPGELRIETPADGPPVVVRQGDDGTEPERVELRGIAGFLDMSVGPFEPEDRLQGRLGLGRLQARPQVSVRVTLDRRATWEEMAASLRFLRDELGWDVSAEGRTDPGWSGRLREYANGGDHFSSRVELPIPGCPCSMCRATTRRAGRELRRGLDPNSWRDVGFTTDPPPAPNPVDANRHCDGCDVDWTGGLHCWMCGEEGEVAPPVEVRSPSLRRDQEVAPYGWH